MSVGMVILCAISGYLIGAISFARIIAKWRAPQIDITTTYTPVLDTKRTIRMNGVSATSVMVQVNKQWGYFAGFLDGLKVFIPVMVLKLIFLSQPYFLIFATAAVMGHNWPIYYRFRGGYGLSTICGGIVVADWPSLLVLFGSMTAVHAISRRPYPAFILGVFALIPWFWFRTHDWWYISYAAIVSMAYFFRVYPDMKAFSKTRPEN